MDPAYFVGRKEILTWINDTFHLNLQKIEETASGGCGVASLFVLHGPVAGTDLYACNMY